MDLIWRFAVRFWETRRSDHGTVGRIPIQPITDLSGVGWGIVPLFLVRGLLMDRTAKIMVDSGASANFVSQAFLADIFCTPVGGAPASVRLARWDRNCDMCPDFC